MRVLKFRLWGKTAFFKKPDVNSYQYFTYSNIHKVAVVGMFGAILGYSGYNQYRQKLNEDKKYDKQYPEFYEKLKDIKISIEPLAKNGSISKKIQVFNNSVGYASQQKGRNLIVKEQWLENPSWNIYLLLDKDESHKICDYITNRKSVYIPYLGKNDHFANIDKIEVFGEDEVSLYTTTQNIERINSLCIKNSISFDMDETNYEEEEEDIFKYSEKLPISLNEITNMYEFENFIYTNMKVVSINTENIYKVANKNIMFY